ncbi:DUF1540 domain-containing protein [Selenihalanaerobacter shriftii]|uniref:DUF1540 domain-containing protein n=1 Tax=Selenihalanaerobacter shriftii TaxID=142842 RepID=A0A1T4LG44_9FIRM|nr:DUF1540 domain-containing protein [Selenihalanaerobacter shriftii]SJZ53663.1 protein of unknown function [Selenihalanaerobacter shriftii]
MAEIECHVINCVYQQEDQCGLDKIEVYCDDNSPYTTQAAGTKCRSFRRE